jgi:hypothetical protein
MNFVSSNIQRHAIVAVDVGQRGGAIELKWMCLNFRLIKL